MDDVFMTNLVALREDLKSPLNVSSGYRCPEHNQRVSSTGMSGPHTRGTAVDVLIYGGEAWRVLRAAPSHGMIGIGVSQKGEHSKRFLHLDQDTEGNRPWIWSY